MAARRRISWVITGLLGLATIAGLTLSGCGGTGKPTETAATPATTTTPAPAQTGSIADKLKQSDVATLATLAQSFEVTPAPAVKALTDAEATEWLLVLNSLRSGYLHFPPQARGVAVDVAEHIMRKFAVDPAPANWLQTLTPFRDILCTGLADRDVDVRATTLVAIGRVWGWYPGRALLPVEEEQLGEWKNAFQTQVVLKLAEANPKTRSAAIVCLSQIPVDKLAEPAVKYVDDPTSAHVRHQVLVSFGNRPTLLTEEMILKRLHDKETGIPHVAEIILKARGLTPDQIVLGRLITSPKPEFRASVIPLLREHEELDPVVWLLKLSHDNDELVRTKAIEAMTGKNSPAILERLREMAAKDASPSVRAAASKLVSTIGPADATTASLPPLPGSPSLTPKAN